MGSNYIEHIQCDTAMKTKSGIYVYINGFSKKQNPKLCFWGWCGIVSRICLSRLSTDSL